MARAWSCASALVGYRYSARAVGLVSSAWSAGRLKHSDLPDAVPVVTMKSPSIAASTASAWWAYSDSMPLDRSASSSLGCSGGSSSLRAGVPPSKASWTRRSSARPSSRSSVQGCGERATATLSGCHPPGVALRCVYLDLDGTLLGRDGSLFHDGEGRPSLLGGRAIEACLRADVEVVLMSGRRRAQVGDLARLMAQPAYVFEAGAGLVVDGEETWLTAPFEPHAELTIHEQIERTGAPALLLDHYAGRREPTDPS